MFPDLAGCVRPGVCSLATLALAGSRRLRAIAKWRPRPEHQFR